jgi:hypothetical protein
MGALAVLGVVTVTGVAAASSHRDAPANWGDAGIQAAKAKRTPVPKDGVAFFASLADR